MMFIGNGFLAGIQSVLGVDADAIEGFYSPFSGQPKVDRYEKIDKHFI